MGRPDWAVDPELKPPDDPALPGAHRCTQFCKDHAIRSPLERARPGVVQVACPWCGAEAGEACRMRTVRRYLGPHPSRLEVAA